LPAMQTGDKIVLSDTLGRVYEYRVADSVQVTPEDTWVTKPVKGRDMVSLQTCIETLGDVYTMGPNWSARYIVRAEAVT
ncbi:MAG: sortase, partial [Actinobacteria bacterium]|nr:sortase [Actinomycetota bacterium]